MTKKLSDMFSKYINEREEKFCNLYTSFFLHEHIISYSNLYQILHVAREMLEKGDSSFESLNYGLYGIEKHFSPEKIENHFEIVKASLKETFLNTDYEYFKEIHPEFYQAAQNNLFNQSDAIWVDEMVESLFRKEFRPYIQQLKVKDSYIQSALKEVYRMDTTTKPKNRNVGTVGNVFLVGTGVQLASANSLQYHYPQNSLDECMELLIDYLDIVDEYYDHVLFNAALINKTFSTIASRFVHKEEKIFNEVSNENVKAELIFKNYFVSEIEDLNETYKCSVDHNDPHYTVEAMVKNVMNIIKDYNFGETKIA